MHQVYLALGSNLGNKVENIKQAVKEISTRIGKVVSISEMHQTEPVGFDSDNDFINAACLVETQLLPLEVLSKSQEIEQEMGRNSKSVNHRYADRIIDIDILFYDNKAHLSLELTLPHPQIQNRMFVLAPMSDIAPLLVHPILNKTIDQLKLNLEKI